MKDPKQKYHFKSLTAERQRILNRIKKYPLHWLQSQIEIMCEDYHRRTGIAYQYKPRQR